MMKLTDTAKGRRKGRCERGKRWLDVGIRILLRIGKEGRRRRRARTCRFGEEWVAKGRNDKEKRREEKRREEKTRRGEERRNEDAHYWYPRDNCQKGS